MKQPHAARPSVIYDPDAVAELLAMKSKEEHRALLNAVRKLDELGEQLGPPHVKPLKGSLRELRPRPETAHAHWYSPCSRPPTPVPTT